MNWLKSFKEEELKKAHEREQSAQSTLVDVSSKLDEQFEKLKIQTNSANDSSAPKPCESFRNAVVQCYEQHGSTNVLACSSQVDAFTECAKQLCNLSSAQAK